MLSLRPPRDSRERDSSHANASLHFQSKCLSIKEQEQGVKSILKEEVDFACVFKAFEANDQFIASRGLNEDRWNSVIYEEFYEGYEKYYLDY